MKYWETIARQLSAADWSWGYTSHLTASGQTVFCVDAHRDDGKRYIVRSDELLTAFLELQTQLR